MSRQNAPFPVGGRMVPWASQADDALDRGTAFELEVALLVAERQARGKVAISAERAHGEHVGFRLRRGASRDRP